MNANDSPAAARRVRCGGGSGALTRGRTDIGALVTFTGICRGAESGEPIAALTLEHYPGMAEAEIARHVEEAEARWPLMGVTVIHRYGRIARVKTSCWSSPRRRTARRPLPPRNS